MDILDTKRGGFAAAWAVPFTVVAALALVISSCGRLPFAMSEAKPSQGLLPTAARPTPGPQAPFVQQVVTAQGVDQNGRPIHPTSQFSVGTPVYVVFLVRGVMPGQPHRVSIRWLLQGQLVQVAGAHASMLVTRDGPASFSLTYPAPGLGMARLYWDEPVNDNSDVPNERFLAQAIAFTIQ